MATWHLSILVEAKFRACYKCRRVPCIIDGSGRSHIVATNDGVGVLRAGLIGTGTRPGIQESRRRHKRRRLVLLVGWYRIAAALIVRQQTRRTGG